SAELLRKSRFLNRLLYSADRPDEDPVMLLVAVVRIDDVAREEQGREEMIAGEARPFPEHFADVQRRIAPHICGQMREQLRLAFTQGDEPLSDAQNAVIERILGGLRERVHPVSAIEYRKVLKKKGGGEDSLATEEQSGIPKLSRCLSDLAEQV